jgi:hypothetical protein
MSRCTTRVAYPRFSSDCFIDSAIRDRMERAGFVAVKLYGSLDGDAYGPNAERLIAIGRKPVSERPAKRDPLTPA